MLGQQQRKLTTNKTCLYIVYIYIYISRYTLWRFQDWVLRNQETLLEAVWACCQSPEPASPTPTPTPIPAHQASCSGKLSTLSSALLLPTMSEAAARTLGCALVEVVTMDTLYNDVTWPDPEFSKVTLERYGLTLCVCVVSRKRLYKL